MTPGALEPEAPQRLGTVVSGSLSRGLDVRLDAAADIEGLKVGSFVTVRGASNRFFGIVTDLRLDSSDPRLASAIAAGGSALTEVLSGTTAYSTASITPMLTTGARRGHPPTRAVAPSPFRERPPRFRRGRSRHLRQ